MCSQDYHYSKLLGYKVEFPVMMLTCALRNTQLSSYQMPSLCESKGREYYISITSHNGRMEFLSRRRIYFNGNSYGFILVKTDKPIYKPGQTGKEVCVCVSVCVCVCVCTFVCTLLVSLPSSHSFFLSHSSLPTTVNICVVYLDKALRPHKADADVSDIISCDVTSCCAYNAH